MINGKRAKKRDILTEKQDRLFAAQVGNMIQ